MERALPVLIVDPLASSACDHLLLPVGLACFLALCPKAALYRQALIPAIFSAMPASLNRPKYLAAAALVLGQVFLGVWPVVGVVVLREMPAQTLVGARILLATPLMLVVARPWRAAMSLREIVQCCGLGVLGVTLNQTAYIGGLSRSTPLNGAVIGCLVPVWTLLIAALLGQEKPRPRQVAGIAVAMTGALGMVYVEHFDFGPERLLGNVLLLASTVAYGA